MITVFHLLLVMELLTVCKKSICEVIKWHYIVTFYVIISDCKCFGNHPQNCLFSNLHLC